MPQFHPVSRQRHEAKRWQRVSSYSFAAQEVLAPLVLAEMVKAVQSFPIAFINQAGSYIPAAVLGLGDGRNLFVAQNGLWAGGYIPAALRGYPFALAQVDEKQVLCVDEDSGLIGEGPAGERFFSDEGTPAPAVSQVLNFLTQTEKNRFPTRLACAALQRHGLIQPWPITLKTAQGDQPVTGLLRIDEAALNALPGDALCELQHAGALGLAYAQLFSMQHLSRLGKLAEAHAKVAQQTAVKAGLSQSKELDLEFLNSETISFGALG